ncbi:hypothetical protein DPMN_019820 [Dreissena polymorpha]|uniref:Uncharacterized protein n=1 Tax=Dreissena polymorpha TaxID=45954 RepID=A0A9D4NHP4_DREPO|nr:hypothetical protein DPMN_019820 [Dreissena polymorpha]
MLRVPSSSKVHPDLLTNKVYVPALLQSMMSSENKKQWLRSAKCKGDWVIDNDDDVDDDDDDDDDDNDDDDDDDDDDEDEGDVD